jgi:Flp pilus assembly protein TadB
MPTFELGSPITISVLFGISLLIMLLFVLPGKQRIDIASMQTTVNLREKFKKTLHRAGIFNQAPSIIVWMIVAASVLAGVLIAILAGNVAYFAAGPIFVVGGVYFYIHGKARRHIYNCNTELVPFINKISTSVNAGVPAEKAYVNAVKESKHLKEVLGHSAALVGSGVNFSDALLETIPLLPFRMWANFVRQIELYNQVGGDIKKTLSATVNQLSRMQTLQAEARADFAVQKQQQRAINFIIIGFLLVSLFIVNNGGEQIEKIFGNVLGIVMFTLGVLVMLAGSAFSSKQMRDIEKRIFF